MDTKSTADQSREHDVSIEELVQEIDLHENMLRNLDGRSPGSSAEQREMINDVLKQLRARLQKIQPQSAWDHLEYAEDDDFLTSLGPQTIRHPPQATSN
jgi:ElaB/YqjD/DUF883 family membrane-anchored ribosome-binding protein